MHSYLLHTHLKLKEEYRNIEMVAKIKYSEHEWPVYGDLKILSMILGQQSGFTKYHIIYVSGITGSKESLYSNRLTGTCFF